MPNTDEPTAARGTTSVALPTAPIAGSNRYSVGVTVHAQVHVHDTTTISADYLSNSTVVVRLGGTVDLFFDGPDGGVSTFCRALKEAVRLAWVRDTATTVSDCRGDDEGDVPRGEYLPPDESVEPPDHDTLPIEPAFVPLGSRDHYPHRVYVQTPRSETRHVTGVQPPDQSTLPLLEPEL